MRFETIKNLKPEDFRRLTEVKIEIFQLMVKVLDRERTIRRLNGGAKDTKYEPQDELLMMLEYWRENRTYFHISQSIGISQSQAWKIIRKCEDSLLKSGLFKIPGKKSLAEKGNYEIVLIDATETPIEKPKKNRENTIQERRKDTL